MKKIVQICLLTAMISILTAQTPQQIKQAKQFAKKTGMTENEVKEAARQRGFSEQEISKAIQKEKKVQDATAGISKESYKQNRGEKLKEISKETLKVNKTEKTEDETNDFKNNELKILKDENIANSVSPSNYFGYDIFKRDPSLFQSTSTGAVDPNYLIGPGDEIIVMLWGETQFRQLVEVDREGFVFIPEIGQVFVNGLNLKLLESKFFRVFSQSYASLNPQGRAPTTFLDISLGNLRPLRIQVLGEVAQPGAYTISPSATLFSSLYYFNGPTTLGSLRDVQLIRNGEKVTSIDFYDFLLTGKKIKDQNLQLDDVIFIPPRSKTVLITGEINRSGIYELKPDEDLEDLISLAGGLKISAYLDRAQIDRIIPFKDREELGMERIFKDVNLNQILEFGQEYLVQDGDMIEIYPVFDNRQNIVEITGAIKRPGKYDLGKSLRLSQLIKKADNTLGDAYRSRIDIIRTQPDLTKKLIILDLEKAINGDYENDILLESSDIVKVYSKSKMINEKFVTITGNVKYPGLFPLMKNMKVNDLIFISGGFIDEEYKESTYLERADLIRMNDDQITQSIEVFDLGLLLESPKSKLNFSLESGDIIRVYEKRMFISNQPVFIRGAVSNPGRFSLKSNMTLKDLILESGGLKENIYKYKIEIVRKDIFEENDNRYAKIISFDINKDFKILELNSISIDNNQTYNEPQFFLLKPFDDISIRPDPYLQNKNTINITGEVLYPGDYVNINKNETITQVIERSGGLLSSAYLETSKYFRDGFEIKVEFSEIVKNSKSILNFNVKDGDRIVIGTYPQVVIVSGEVNNQGVLKYVPGKRLKYYLNLAGGLSPKADKNNVWVNYPNGNAKKYKNLLIFGPKIMDGSVINIGLKEQTDPLDKTEFAKEVSSIFASLVQTIAVIFLASK